MANTMAISATIGVCPIECQVEFTSRESANPTTMILLVLTSVFLLFDFAIGVIAVASSHSHPVARSKGI